MSTTYPPALNRNEPALSSEADNVLRSFESCRNNHQVITAIDTFQDLEHQHKQNQWQAFGLTATSLAALSSCIVNIANINKTCVSNPESYACGTAIASAIGSSVGTLGLVASARALLMGRTRFSQKKTQLNDQFNAKVVSVTNPVDREQLKNVLSQFYELKSDEQTNIRNKIARSVSEIIPPS